MGFKEFFQTIQWGATLQVALIRVAIASLLWPLIFVIFGSASVSEFFPQVFTFFLLLLTFLAVAIPAIGLARADVPFVGLAALPAWLVVIADPFVKLLHSKKPEWVPVAEFKFINPPVLAVFGQDNEDVNLSASLEPRNEHPVSDPLLDNGRSTGLFNKLTSANDDVPSSTPHKDLRRSDEAQRIYEEGLKIFEQGDEKEGLIRISEAIQIDPQHIEANLFLASAFHHIDPIEHAEQIFFTTNNVLSTDPNNERAKNILATTHFELGKHAWDAENWEKATDSFRESYRLNPTSDHLGEALAFCAENAGLLGEVVGDFEERLAKEPSDHGAQFLAGRSYMKLATNQDARESPSISQQEAIRRAEAHLRAVLHHDPKDVDANYWLAPAYVMTNRDEDAKKIIEMLRSVAPEKAVEIAGLME